jgi:lysophospholipase L1-like esterase
LKTQLRTVVLFGDSNTWGYIPGTEKQRYPRDVRWAGRLATALDGEWEVISEGLNGRTATVERPDREGCNGLPYLVPCLRSHQPVDLVVIFLGTNDINYMDDGTVAQCVERLHKVARNSEAGPNSDAPAVLVVCPPPFAGRALGAWFADEVTCELLDLDGVTPYAIVGDDLEHLDEHGHAAVARAVEERVRRMFP